MPDLFHQDPDEVLDYIRDWGPELGDDTIATSTWLPDDGITADNDDHDDTTATIWISGGTLNGKYRVTNRITTNAGRTIDHTLTFWIRQQ